jgi:lysophospholipase L1-like esterase
MNESMIKVQKGAYAVWRLLGLTPALALLDGRMAAAATLLVVWASGFRAIHAALAMIGDTATLTAYLRHPVTRVAAIVVVVLVQSWAILVSGLGAVGVVMLAAVVAMTVAAASPGLPDYSRRLAGLLLMTGSLVVCLLVMELVLWGVDVSRPTNDSRTHTWGREVRWNGLGFREREFDTPKPPDTFRVMVLGDSLTWGVGLSEEQRYSRLMEQQLQQHLGHRSVEVLNFGLDGVATVHERDFLMQLAGIVQPDCVVVGFCVNDTQPRAQSYAVEVERYRPVLAAFGVLKKYGLGRTAGFLNTRTDQLLRNVGLVPQWPDALDRTYAPDSAEWLAFDQALAEIRDLCARRGMPRPVFVPLLQGSGDFNEPDPLLARFLAWSAQAEAAARGHGFTTVNMLASFKAQGFRNRSVNRWDHHPSAECNRIYASHIADAIAPIVAGQQVDDQTAMGDTG